MKTRAVAAVLGLQLATVGATALYVERVHASPLAAPGESLVRQNDGSVIAIRHLGNADNQWFETPEGFSVVRSDTGNWVYLVPSSETAHSLVSGGIPSKLIVGRDDPSAAKIEPHLRPMPVPGFSEHNVQSTARAVGGSNPISNVSGEIPLVVILGYYDDALSAPNCARCATTDPEVFKNTIFGEDGNSVVDYFAEVSHGVAQLVPVHESHGTFDDGIIGWLRLGATTPEGTVSSTSAYKSNRIAADAINAAMDHIDFTAYDANDDGRITSREVSLLIVVGAYEGSYGSDASGVSLTSDTTSPRFWGQSRSFVSSFSGVSIPSQTNEGKTVTIDTRSGGMTYSIIGELHGAHPATLGIMVHELGHSTFALPDLYDIGGESNGVGVWSAMGYGSWGKRPTDPHPGDTPALLDAWSRVALGWVTPVIPAAGDTVTVNVAGAGEQTVYALPTGRSKEYFLVENRQNTGYDEGVPYLFRLRPDELREFGGLAVWHIDDNVGTAGLNNDNANESHRRVDLVAAVGDAALDNASSYGRPTNLYYEGNRTTLDDDTTPSAHLYNGDDSGVAVREVSSSGASMAFKGFYSSAADSITLNTTNLDAGEELSTVGDAAGDGGGGGAMAPLLLPGLVWMRLRRRVRT